jgi:hypothetical protein
MLKIQIEDFCNRPAFTVRLKNDIGWKIIKVKRIPADLLEELENDFQDIYRLPVKYSIEKNERYTFMGYIDYITFFIDIYGYKTTAEMDCRYPEEKELFNSLEPGILYH